jgi:hypothetical protein
MIDKQEVSTADELAQSAAADNFKLINGVGPAIAQRLQEAGVQTFAELAALSPGDIFVLVGDLAGMSVERIERQDWIGQAQALMSEAARGDSAQAPAASANRQHNQTFTVTLLLDDSNQVRRTRVVHVQNGQESAWAGWHEARLKQFIVNYANLRFPTTANQDPAGVPSLKKLAVVSAVADKPGNFIRHNQPFGIALTLDLSEVVFSENNEITVTAIIYARSLENNTPQIVGETVSTTGSTDTLSLSLVGRAVPVGMYRLEALVIVGLQPNGPDFTTRLVGGDLFQVY